MIKTIALSGSASPDSMNYRGLELLNKNCPFDIDSLANYDIPVINTNASDGIVPQRRQRCGLHRPSATPRILNGPFRGSIHSMFRAADNFC